MFETAWTLQRLLVLGGVDGAALREALWLLVGAILGSAIALTLAYAINLHERLKTARRASKQVPPGDRRP
jgi:hypothetical protein